MNGEPSKHAIPLPAKTGMFCWSVSLVAILAAVGLIAFALIVRTSVPPPRNLGEFAVVALMGCVLLALLGVSIVISLACAAVVLCRGNRSGFLLAAANAVLIAWVACICNGYGLPPSKHVDGEFLSFVTFNVDLPNGSRIIATKRDYFLQDAHWYLVFDADAAGIARFAQDYSGGVLLERYARDRFAWMDTVSGMPWDLTGIRNGRYYRRKNTNGFVSIDLDKNRVYVFR